jgi:putative NADH-flavin reductase
MKILILGATGRTGKYLLNEALENGYEINVLVRNAKKVNAKAKILTIYEGNPTNIKELKIALTGCSSVLSALNISRNSDIPWATLRTPKDFLEKTLKNLIILDKEIKLEKIIVLSAWGVAETKKDIPFWFRILIDLSNMKYGYLAHEKSEEILQKSNLKWKSIRPVGLVNSEKIKPIITTINKMPKPRLTISRKSVAQFMINVLENKLYDNQAVTISS